MRGKSWLCESLKNFMLETSRSTDVTSQTAERFYVSFLKNGPLTWGEGYWKLGYRGCCTTINEKLLINKLVLEERVSLQNSPFHCGKS